MPEVNRRSYRSPKRTEQAAATRASILDAAAELFDAGGYTRTTTSAIARRAAVSEAAIFASFGSKAGLLQALIDRAVVPDGDAGGLAATPAWSDAAAADALAAVARFAALAASVQQRTWKLIDLSRTASDGDPAMATLLEQGAANRRADCRTFAGLTLGGSLRDDVAVEEAADVLWAYTSADVYRLLVHDAGWPHERYVHWLTETLQRALVISR